MTLTIHSRKLDVALTFTCYFEGDGELGYVFLDRNPRSGAQNVPICPGGRLIGSTITATPATFHRVVRNWYNRFAARTRSPTRLKA